MAGKSLDTEQIRQILKLYGEGIPIREIGNSIKPPVCRNTVKKHVRFIRNNLLKVDRLLKMEDEELASVFHKGNPAYPDKRMEGFLNDIRVFEDERHKPGMTVFNMWTGYVERHKLDHYGLTQFRYHLSQLGVLPDAYKRDYVKILEGEEVTAIVTVPCIAVFYTDTASGWVSKIEVLSLYLPASGTIRVCALKSLDIKDLVEGLNRILFKLGGVPNSLVTTNLLRVACRLDKGLPPVSSIIRYMSSYYGFDMSTSVNGLDVQDLSRMETALNHLNHMLCEGVFNSDADVELALREFEERYNRSRIPKRDWTREEGFIREEAPRLKVLPDAPYEVAPITPHTPDRDGTIQVGKGRETGYYSVPVAFIGNTVKCLRGESRIAIFGGGRLITAHPRVSNYNYSLHRDHVEEWEQSQYNNLEILVYEAYNKGYNTGLWTERFFQRHQEDGHHRQECVRKHRYIMLRAQEDEGLMDTFCTICLKNGIFNYGQFVGAFNRFRDNWAKDKSLDNNNLNRD